MRPGSRRKRPWWRCLAAIWRARPHVGRPGDDAVLVLAVCGAIALGVVSLYVLGV
jgi:hypothetical protein